MIININNQKKVQKNDNTDIEAARLSQLITIKFVLQPDYKQL